MKIFVIIAVILHVVWGRCYVGFNQLTPDRIILFTNCQGGTSKDLTILKNIEPFPQVKLLDLQNFSGDFEEDTLAAFPNLEILQIRESRFKGLTKTVLKQCCENITNIIFRKNKHVLDKDLFENSKKLKHVVINLENLPKIDADLFKGLNDLEGIVVNSSFVKEIDENAFSHLKKLQLLELHNNDIEEIKPKTFENLTSLKTLTLLNNNKLVGMNETALKNLSNLELLGLPSEIISKIEVPKLKEMMPKLQTVLFKTQDEDCHKEFLDKLKSNNISVLLVTFVDEPQCIKN